MLQNDEALYYGKPHRCYITPKSFVVISVVSINFKVIILFLLVANLIRGFFVFIRFLSRPTLYRRTHKAKLYKKISDNRA